MPRNIEKQFFYCVFTQYCVQIIYYSCDNINNNNNNNISNNINNTNNNNNNSNNNKRNWVSYYSCSTFSLNSRIISLRMQMMKTDKNEPLNVCAYCYFR